MDKDKEKKTSKGKKGKKAIIDFTKYRKHKNEERRREYERILFNRLLGAYIFAEKNQLKHVEVMDISYTGIKFREEDPEIPHKVGDKLMLRFYFTPDSYLRLGMMVKRANAYDEDGSKGLQYGCELDKNTRSYASIRPLISFLYKYAETACFDERPPPIWF